MARDTYRAFAEQLDKISPQLRRAFEEAVADITSTSQLAALEDAIRRGNVEAALRALSLDQSFWQPLDRAMNAAFLQGGLYQAALLSRRTAPRLDIRFNERNQRAEEWVRNKSSALIVEITNETRDMVRNVVTEGLEAGQGPRTVARTILGAPQGNGRTGGFLGLTTQQAGYVTAARQQLVDLDASYFRRKRRDKRFDATVRKAIRDGEPLTATQIERITMRYSERLLKLRSETIARTESIAALNAARYEAIQQAIDSGQIPASAVQLEWMATPGPRTRDTHRAMDKQQVDFGRPFVSPSGALMKHPGDFELGAPAAETINCRCGFRQVIDFVEVARLRGTL